MKLKGLVTRHTLLVLIKEVQRIEIQPEFQIGSPRLTTNNSSNSQVMSWLDFTVDFESAEPQFTEQHRQICDENPGKFIDLDKFMTHANILHTVDHKDKIQKCLDVFRMMNLRTMLVRESDKIVGVIVR